MGVLSQLNIYTLKGNSDTNINQLYGLGINTLEGYDIEDFITLCPEFKSLFDGNESNRYNIMWTMWFNQAKDIFTQEYGDNILICATWYIAHRLELSVGANKNFGNRANLSSENMEGNMLYNQGGKEKSRGTNNMSGLEKDLCRTTYGQNLYEVMKIVGKTRVMGVH